MTNTSFRTSWEHSKVYSTFVRDVRTLSERYRLGKQKTRNMQQQIMQLLPSSHGQLNIASKCSNCITCPPHKWHRSLTHPMRFRLASVERASRFKQPWWWWCWWWWGWGYWLHNGAMMMCVWLQMKGKGKGMQGDKDCPLQFPDLQNTDFAKDFPKLAEGWYCLCTYLFSFTCHVFACFLHILPCVVSLSALLSFLSICSRCSVDSIFQEKNGCRDFG